MKELYTQHACFLKWKIYYPFNWIQLSDPVIWIWTAVYTCQVNWKNAANCCEYAFEILALYLWRSLFLVKLQAASNLTKLNSFISIFKGFAKSVSYWGQLFKRSTSYPVNTRRHCNDIRRLYDDESSYRRLLRRVSASQCSFNANLKT